MIAQDPGVAHAIYDLIWPEEKPGFAQAMGAHLLSLREKPMPLRIKSVNMSLSQENNRQVALVLISDDASKLASVQHVPTDVLFRLGCTSLATARMRLEARLSKEERGESADLKSVMDSQMAELRRQLGDSMKKQEYLDHKMSGMTEVVVDMKHSVMGEFGKSHTQMGQIDENVHQWGSILAEVKKLLEYVVRSVKSIGFNLNGFIADAGMQPREDMMRTGIANALR